MSPRPGVRRGDPYHEAKDTLVLQRLTPEWTKRKYDTETLAARTDLPTFGLQTCPRPTPWVKQTALHSCALGYAGCFVLHVETRTAFSCLRRRKLFNKPRTRPHI